MADPNNVWDRTELCRHFDLLQFYTMPHVKIYIEYRIFL